RDWTSACIDRDQLLSGKSTGLDLRWHKHFLTRAHLFHSSSSLFATMHSARLIPTLPVNKSANLWLTLPCGYRTLGEQHCKKEVPTLDHKWLTRHGFKSRARSRRSFALRTSVVRRVRVGAGLRDRNINYLRLRPRRRSGCKSKSASVAPRPPLISP